MPNNIRALRLQRNMSITDLAIASRIDMNDVSKAERGARPLYPAWRQRIASALNVAEGAL